MEGYTMCGGAFMETCGYVLGQTQRKDLEATLQGLFFGGRYRTRTCDLLHVKQMLYQLS